MRILAADWVFPPGEPGLKRGALLMEGARLVDLGDCKALKARAPHAEVRNFERHALIPGLINCHTHLELASIERLEATRNFTGAQGAPGAEGFTKAGGFTGWVRALLARKAQLTEERIAEDAKAAAQKILAAGTAYVADIASSFATVRAIEEAGLPATVFREFLGLQPEAIDAFLEARPHFEARHSGRISPDSRLPASTPESTSIDSRIRARVLPACHAPFSTSPALFEAVGAWALAHAAVTTVHLAESTDESELIEKGCGAFLDLIRDRGIDVALAPHAGASPVAYADRIGFLGPNVIAVHLVQATDEDLALVKARGAWPCLCPSSNLHLTGKLPRIRAMLDLDLAPCLGTDSTASGESLNLFNEMAILMDAGVTPEEALVMGTRNGARALRLPGRFGAFEKGTTPALCSLPLDKGGDERPLECALLAGARGEARWIVPPSGGMNGQDDGSV